MIANSKVNLLSVHDFNLIRAAGFSNTQAWNPFNQERFRNLIKMVRLEENMKVKNQQLIQQENNHD
jgi:hypothetical protein